ncbi:hypothetical protein [Deinococcus roseus]|uniref:Uncharacterized protein n=1 Tax=Deinococcus roseus TaxID=392414 RepID=A0ABQ2DJH3_9DEIO|nr:hypothetical protein [Deinococcus roseus]GGJ59351.1 hypothetical protein GCM10008938_51870 [Deinococcus roseus]
MKFNPVSWLTLMFLSGWATAETTAVLSPPWATQAVPNIEKLHDSAICELPTSPMAYINGKRDPDLLEAIEKDLKITLVSSDLKTNDYSCILYVGTDLMATQQGDTYLATLEFEVIYNDLIIKEVLPAKSSPYNNVPTVLNGRHQFSIPIYRDFLTFTGKYTPEGFKAAVLDAQKQLFNRFYAEWRENALGR